MLFIPSLSSSYFASDHQVEDLDKNLVGIVRDVEMVERELHSVVATLSDLASKLSQLKVKTKELAAGCSNQAHVGSASLQASTSSQPERGSKPALEAVDRLVGEVDLEVQMGEALGAMLQEMAVGEAQASPTEAQAVGV